MLDKTKKIIYIITGTLTIISLVFMLMHKVGLCASSGGSGVVYVPSSSVELPFYIYNASPLSDSEIEECIATAYESAWAQYLTDNYMVCVVDDNGTGIQVRVFCPDNIKMNYSWSDFFSGTGYIAIDVDSGVQMYVNKTTRAIYDVSYRSADISLSYANCGSASPTGGNKILQVGQIYTNYPIASNVDNWNIASNSNYNASDLVFSLPASSGITLEGGTGEVTTLPSMEDLTGSPSSGDSNDSLFSLLKGWLSSINGNIKKGFTNIYDNITSFLKPYLDRFKSVTDLIENPEDFLFCSQERQQELLQGSQVYHDVQSLQGIGNNIFGVLGASASDHVYWTFDFSDTVLDSCGVVQIDFDWYESIRNYVVPLFMAFFYVGMLLLIIRKIPGIISGASSNSDDK